MYRVFIAVFMIAVSALFLTGRNLEAVAAKNAAKTVEAKLPAALIKRHQSFPGCVRLNGPVMPKNGSHIHARLDEDTELFAIMCEPSAYNFPYAVYIVRDGSYDDAERVYFADYALETGWYGAPVLYNPDFDQKTGLLSSFSKSRGPGDCGSRGVYKWDGNQLVLQEFRYKDECDGDISTPFPLLYKRAIHRN